MIFECRSYSTLCNPVGYFSMTFECRTVKVYNVERCVYDFNFVACTVYVFTPADNSRIQQDHIKCQNRTQATRK